MSSLADFSFGGVGGDVARGVNVDRTYSSMTSAVHDPTSTVLRSSASSPKAVSVGGAPRLNSNATS